MTVPRRLSAQSIAVLGALQEAGDEWRYGLEVSAVTGLKSGSLYPILARLSDRGLLESKWLEPVRSGRPPRHAYRLTAPGRAALKASCNFAAPVTLDLKGAY